MPALRTSSPRKRKTWWRRCCESAADRARASSSIRLPGHTSTRLASAAAKGGTIFLYGILSQQPTPFPLFKALINGLTLRGYTLFEITLDPARLSRGVAFVKDGLAGGALKPVIAKTFPLDQIIEAHRYMESNQQIGKIVVTV